MRHERLKPPALGDKAEERRIVLLRALWARHSPDGKESSDGR